MAHPEISETDADPIIDALHAPDAAVDLDPAVVDSLHYEWPSDEAREEFLTDLFSGTDSGL